MEDFTKNQLVLLGVFISFVTSMVTGVVVVSLMRQEPTGVVQTINRVVERTVEKVVPPQEKEIITEKEVVTKEVVIKESDLVAKATERGVERIAGLFYPAGEKNEMTPLGSAYLMQSDATFVTAYRHAYVPATDEVQAVSRENLYIRYAGVFVPARVIGADSRGQLALVRIATTTTDDAVTLLSRASKSTALPTVNLDGLKLGQLVIALDGVGKATVQTGIISSFDVEIVASEAAAGATGQVSGIVTNIPSAVTGLGGVVVTRDGEFVGISTNDPSGSMYRAIPMSRIVDMVQGLITPAQASPPGASGT